MPEGASTETKPNPVIQLTSGMAWDMQPRFSPDGKRSHLPVIAQELRKRWRQYLDPEP